MAATQLTVLLNSTWAIESPIIRKEGIAEAFALKVLGAGTLTLNFVRAYKKKVNLSSTVFPTGAQTASDNVVTTKPFTVAGTGLGVAGVYVVNIGVTEGGNDHVYSFVVKVQKATSEQ